MPPALTPLLRAAVTIVALRVLDELDLPHPAATEVVESLGVSRSRAYELAHATEELLPSVQRPAGRPNKEAAEPPDDVAFVVACRVRDFLLDHPGAAHGGVRHWYGEAFKLFVFDLLAPGGDAHGMSIQDAAIATGVPEETLRDWLRNPRPCMPATRSAVPPPGVAVPSGVLAQILALYEDWNGPVDKFQKALREHHRIHIGLHQLRSFLRLFGLLGGPKPRKKSTEAIRGALERFFPGAQLMADGKHLVVYLDGEPHAVNWELVVDAATGGHVGFDVSPVEDGEALIDAVDMALDTLPEDPLALLADNKPSNYSEEVQEAMEQRNILLMPSTVGRPENKSTVEGGFGLFSQTMPDINVDTSTPETLVHDIVFHILWAYCAGRNQAPQSRRKGKSAIELFDESTPSEEQRNAANDRLTEIKKRILERCDAERQRLDPVALLLAEREMADMGLPDPEGSFAREIAKTGFAAALEGLAIFRSKKDAGTVQTDFPERYLLGIAQHVATRNEDINVYFELLRLRIEANDLLLAPLLRERARMPHAVPLEYARAVIDKLRPPSAIIDRRFWMREFTTAIEQIDAAVLLIEGPWLARRLAGLFKLPQSDRDFLIAALAAATAA